MEVRHSAERRGRRLWLLLAVLVVALSAVAAGCGGGGEEAAPPPAEPAAPPAEEPAPAPAEETAAAETTEGAGEPIKLGISSTCEGPFSAVYEATLAGALAPYIAHGATANGPLPSDGVTWEVNGHPVEIVFGCSDATPDKALSEARRLVEQEGVQILHAPLSGSEGIADGELLPRAARRHVPERHVGCAGHDAKDPVPELLPLPHGRRAVDGGPG